MVRRDIERVRAIIFAQWLWNDWKQILVDENLLLGPYQVKASGRHPVL